jgi:hypothetical protein
VLPATADAENALDAPVLVAPSHAAPEARRAPRAEPRTAVVVLTTGERLVGEVVGGDDEAIVLRHAVLGDLRIPRAHVDAVEPVVPPDAQPAPAGQPAGQVAPDAPAAETGTQTPDAPEPPAPPTSWLRGWRGSVDIGASGSGGNSDTLSLRGSIGARRQTPTHDTRTGVSYLYSADSGTASASRGEAFLRNDWVWPDSRWGLFAQSRAEYDEFQDWDWRLSGSIGPSYALIKTDRTNLRVRGGMGFSALVGGEDDGLTPEGLLGADFEIKLNDRSRLFATAEYLPSLDDVPEFRAVARAGIEILLNAENKTNLKIGVADRYTTTPGPGRSRNDIDAFLTLGWEF